MIKAHSIAATLAITSLLAWSGPPGGLHELQAGQNFEIIGELHAHAVRDDFTSSAVAVVTLIPLRLSGPEIISRQQVPYGSVMTVLGRAPKRFLAFLYADRFVVRLDTIEPPAGIQLVLDLSRGSEGVSTPLNPRIYKPLF